MRHLLLALLLSLPLSAAIAEDGAFGELLVRKPVNGVCPIDGKPVDQQLTPVSMASADAQEVLVGACSIACQQNLRAKFGPDSHTASAAAKSNTTIAASRSAAPATGLTAAPAASATSSASASTFGSPATTSPSPFGPAPTAGGLASAPRSQPAESGVVQTAPKVEAKPRAAAKPRVVEGRGDQSDERQRQKKAAQRADRTPGRMY